MSLVCRLKINHKKDVPCAFWTLGADMNNSHHFYLIYIIVFISLIFFGIGQYFLMKFSCYPLAYLSYFFVIVLSLFIFPGNVTYSNRKFVLQCGLQILAIDLRCESVDQIGLLKEKSTGKCSVKSANTVQEIIEEKGNCSLQRILPNVYIIL
jgi:hypothetical protein